MKTFSIQTLGCRVNHYESEQIAAVLVRRGLAQVPSPAGDVRVVHTCSVTTAAAKGSRQSVRRATRLTVLGQDETPEFPAAGTAKVVVTGCWATSDPAAAAAIAGVDAVITNHEDVNARLTALLDDWAGAATAFAPDDGARLPNPPVALRSADAPRPRRAVGSTSLPLLDARQSAHTRAFLKIQDGCDAHCTYCIIPQLRPTLWSKSPADAVAEARALVAAGHREIVLTGIFLGAYGKPTALRRRQTDQSEPIATLIHSLCTEVPNLSRVRLSSLEPGDLTPTLLRTLQSHAQVVPHFHLPLQSGSDPILRKMNRQYTRAQYLDTAAMLRDAFDRPAITTDIIAAFPGETDADFAATLDVAERVRFIHTHAFPYSRRPNTAAARWKDKAVPPDVANARIAALTTHAAACGLAFRQSFLGETVTILVERQSADRPGTISPLRHGRCERYFDVAFDSAATAGDHLRVRIDHVTAADTRGTVLGPA
ncbi:MAG TPA: MiaB/RimO family radical SAM methylthiotransferase [Tepidisphaeraceae bacterium]|jgi:threonylcarbamoyladenosine tRNA methylthiotransferase MtaB